MAGGLLFPSCRCLLPCARTAYAHVCGHHTAKVIPVVINADTFCRAHCNEHKLLVCYRLIEHLARRLENQRWNEEMLDWNVHVAGPGSPNVTCRPCETGLTIAFRYGHG